MESILMFVVIAIISSLFSKDKSGHKRRPPYTPTQPQTNTKQSPLKNTRQSTRQNTTSNTVGRGERKVKGNENNRRLPDEREVFTYETIEDIEANYYHLREEARPKEPVNRLTNYQQSNKQLKVVDVETMELEKESKLSDELLSFTPNSIVQAIIMSEVLDKPKSMRR